MRTVVCVCLTLLVGSDAWGQRFDLVEPTGLVTASGEVQRGRIMIIERTGQRWSFSRESRYDSADGQFLGYFSFETNQVLRFPRALSGPMQTADLSVQRPQFQYTQRVVRPVRALAADAQYGFPYGQPNFNPSLPIIAGPIYTDPYSAGFRGAYRLPQSVLIDSKTVPNPPLPPARLQLLNSGPREIQILLVDLQSQVRPRSMRIRPSEAIEVELVRDSGGQRIQRFRAVTLSGESITKEIVTPIVPQVRYEIVVHEWQMQSVAIDRTGKSPNPIEDVNFQGRGLGRFPLPPGPELRDGTIDVYRTAINNQNAGAVAPIYPQEGESDIDAPSPLERAVIDAQIRAGK